MNGFVELTGRPFTRSRQADAIHLCEILRQTERDLGIFSLGMLASAIATRHVRRMPARQYNEARPESGSATT